MRLTDAGRAALADGTARGVRAVQIRMIAVGTGRGPGGAADDSRVALRAEQARAAVGGSTTVSGRIAVTADVSASAAYDVTEIGVYARIGDAGADFLFGYQVVAAGEAALARAEVGVTLTIGVVIEVARASAEVTVTLSPLVTLMTWPPTGTILDYAGDVVPAGYLLCDGRAVSRTTYAALYAVLGTRYGAGDGSTTFGLPDLRRRVALGSGGAGSAEIANTLGATGGEESHALTLAELPAHTHAGSAGSAGAHTHGAGSLATARDGSHHHTIPYARDHQHYSGAGAEISLTTASGASTEDTGDDGTHDHAISGSTSRASSHRHSLAIDAMGGGQATSLIQPSIVLHKIIRT